MSGYQLKGLQDILSLQEQGRLLDSSDDIDEEDEETQSFFESVDESLTLTRTERFYGFVICFVIGWLISFASMSALPSIVLKPKRFALLYSLGNIVSMASTAFLYGPVRQLKSMFDESRRISTLVYLGSILATLYSAYYIQNLPIVLTCMVIQFCAMVWYCASFIPFGREILAKCIFSCCGCLSGGIKGIV